MIKILLGLLLAIQVFANEGEGKEEAGAAEGKAEAEAPSADQKANKELADVEKQVASLAAKIKAKNESIEKLLTEKSTAADPEKSSELVKLVQQEHREVQELTREYNTQLGILQYRFPERGVTLGRRYQRLNTKSLEDMEKNLGLEANLKRSREKIKTVYGVKSKPTSKKQGSAKKEETPDEKLLQPATLSK